METPNQIPEEVIQLLRANVIFKDADDEALRFVAQHLEAVQFPKGAPIVVENEPSDHVYFIMIGAVEVVKHLVELKQMNRLAILRVGQHFSEFSVLNRTPKSASVFAFEDCTLLRMSGESFMNILSHIPAITSNLVRQLAEMTNHAQIARGGVEYFRSENIEISEFIPQLFPLKMWNRFHALPLSQKSQGLFMAVKNPHNLELFNFFKTSQPALQIHLTLISDTDFEHLSKELSDAYSGKAHKFHLAQKIKPSPAIESVPQLLEQCTLFRDFPADYRAQIAQHCKVENYPAGTKIYKAGTVSDRLYVLLSGEVDIYRQLETENSSIYVSTTRAGEYFSEISLLNKRPHGLCARSTSPVRVAVFEKQTIDRLIVSPLFTLPLARDLARRFLEINSNLGLKTFNKKIPVEIATLNGILPRSIIEEYQIMPLYLKDNELIVGTVTSECESIYPLIGRYLQDYRVSLEVIALADFKSWLGELDTGTRRKTATEHASDTDAVGTLDRIIEAGFDLRASDVYIEPTSSDFVVRLRVDGVLREYAHKIPKHIGVQMVNRIKVLSQLDTTMKFVPQDGQLKVAMGSGEGFARVSTMPTKHGENAVLRLIRERQSVPPLPSLIPDRRAVTMLQSVARSKQGVFLITGPTGSGKSTTLYSLLKELNRVEVSIITVEDPVEMEVPGITQVEVNEKQSLTFATALRSVLRQAPDVIMIGEIRDEESAKVAFHAAMTGHLVIATLHTNNSLEVVPRLIEMGVPAAGVASGLIGASAQRLMRQVCMKCRDIRPTTAQEQKIFKSHLPLMTPPIEVAHPKGCGHCQQRGYMDRIPVFEIWQKTEGTERAINKSGGWHELYPEVKKQGFDTLVEFALKMVMSKLTTLEEVQRALGVNFENQNKSWETKASDFAA